MNAKLFEIRDRMTFIPVLAVHLAPSREEERYLLARAGYGEIPREQSQYVLLIRIAGGQGPAHCDPYEWSDRTMQSAHLHIRQHWDTLEPGAVVDVEYLLGEKPTPALSEAQS